TCGIPTREQQAGFRPGCQKDAFYCVGFRLILSLAFTLDMKVEHRHPFKMSSTKRRSEPPNIGLNKAIIKKSILYRFGGLKYTGRTKKNKQMTGQRLVPRSVEWVVLEHDQGKFKASDSIMPGKLAVNSTCLKELAVDPFVKLDTLVANVSSALSLVDMADLISVKYFALNFLDNVFSSVLGFVFDSALRSVLIGPASRDSSFFSLKPRHPHSELEDDRSDEGNLSTKRLAITIHGAFVYNHVGHHPRASWTASIPAHRSRIYVDKPEEFKSVHWIMTHDNVGVLIWLYKPSSYVPSSCDFRQKCAVWRYDKCITYIHVSRYLEYRSNGNMRRPGTADSVAWKHHKREIQLVSSCCINIEECFLRRFLFLTSAASKNSLRQWHQGTGSEILFGLIRWAQPPSFRQHYVLIELKLDWNRRRPGAAHSVAWKNHKREIQLGSSSWNRIPSKPRSIKLKTVGFVLCQAGTLYTFRLNDVEPCQQVDSYGFYGKLGRHESGDFVTILQTPKLSSSDSLWRSFSERPQTTYTAEVGIASVAELKCLFECRWRFDFVSQDNNRNQETVLNDVHIGVTYKTKFKQNKNIQSLLRVRQRQSRSRFGMLPDACERVCALTTGCSEHGEYLCVGFGSCGLETSGIPYFDVPKIELTIRSMRPHSGNNQSHEDPTLTIPHLREMPGEPRLDKLAVSQPSCNLRVAWQLGTERVLQPNGFLGRFRGVYGPTTQTVFPAQRREFYGHTMFLQTNGKIRLSSIIITIDSPHSKHSLHEWKLTMSSTSISSHIFQRLQPGAAGTTRCISYETGRTDNIQPTIHYQFHTPLPDRLGIEAGRVISRCLRMPAPDDAMSAAKLMQDERNHQPQMTGLQGEDRPVSKFVLQPLSTMGILRTPPVMIYILRNSSYESERIQDPDTTRIHKDGVNVTAQKHNRRPCTTRKH
ncbi:hypothetical protein CLF_100627, partial [Clonorchis sinensis]